MIFANLEQLIAEKERKRLEEGFLVAKLNEMTEQLREAIEQSREITGV